MSGGAWVYCESPNMQDRPPKRRNFRDRLRTMAKKRPTIPEARMWMRLGSEATVVRLVMEDETLTVWTDPKRNTVHVVLACDLAELERQSAPVVDESWVSLVQTT